MTGKDEILANFQACSGIEDVGEAFTRLEAANWNLAEAVNSIFGQSPGGFSASNSAAASNDVVPIDVPDDLSVPMPLVASASSAARADSGSAAASNTDASENMLQINIQVLVGGMTGKGSFPLEIPMSTTVAELRGTLYELLGITPCKQVLRGFKGEVNNMTVLTPELLGDDKTLTVDTSGSSPTPTFMPVRLDAPEDDIMEIGGDHLYEPVVVGTVPPASTSSSVSLAHTYSNTSAGLPSSSKYSYSGHSGHSKHSRSSHNFSSSNNTSDVSKSTPYSSLSSTNNQSSLQTSSSSKSSVSNHTSKSSSKRSSSLKNNSSSSSSSHSAGATSLGADNKLLGQTTAIADDPGEGGSSSGDGRDYTLTIKDLTNNKSYTISYSGRKDVYSIKQDVSDVTGIPVHRQQWTGWPKDVKDSCSLSLAGISRNQRFTVTQCSPSSSSKTTPRGHRKGVPKNASDSSSDEFEDATELQHDDDDTFLEMMDAAINNSKPNSLLPAELTGTEEECVDNFVQEFTLRYGSSTPLFFQGLLSEAIDQSVMLPAAQRRMLALYIHHDGSVQANVFCSQVLCQTATISFLADNFVLWGWDITHKVHHQRLVARMISLIGSPAGMTVGGFRSEQLPAIMLLTRNRGSCEVLSVIYASTSSLDSVVTGLMEAVELFEDTRNAEVVEDEQRKHRQDIMNDQDVAYQESLRQDRAKAEMKRQQEEDEQREVMRQKSVMLHEQEMTEKLRASLQSELPPEPQNTESPDVTVMRFRQPGNEQFTRAFNLDTELQVVLNFLHVRGFPADGYKFLQSWPRRDLASLNVAKTLRHFNIQQQETITIEER
uniref:FAS-associated factor 1-like n=1 Tax=Hirondellea gigas TaxID=1518452 RepID=A0A6A7FUX8_9CRUS